MRPPRFARDLADLDRMGRQAKTWTCPRCAGSGTLNRHGRLRGWGEGAAGKQTQRGQRFYCSKRGRRHGCGHTFSLKLCTVLAHASVRSAELWRFYRAKLWGQSVLSAWASLRSRFSLEAAYGWWRRWQRGQCALRTHLCRGRDPPETSLAEGIQAAFGPVDPIACFQHQAQRPWPGSAS